MNDYLNVFTHRVGSSDKYLGKPPVFYNTQELLSNPSIRFTSVYRVRAEDAKAIVSAGTAEGFKGIVWSPYLSVDCDTEESSRAAQSRLTEKGIEHHVYTTGNRGCHISIPRPCEPSHLLPQQDKAWVQINLDGADLSLYWHLHLFRRPGARHEKTNRLKTLLHSVPGQPLTLEPYTKTEEVKETTPLAGNSHSTESIFDKWSISRYLTTPRTRKQLVALCAACKAEGIEEPITTWILREVNKALPVPRADSEIVRIVRHYFI